MVSMVSAWQCGRRAPTAATVPPPLASPDSYGGWLPAWGRALACSGGQSKIQPTERLINQHAFLPRGSGGWQFVIGLPAGLASAEGSLVGQRLLVSSSHGTFGEGAVFSTRALIPPVRAPPS